MSAFKGLVQEPKYNPANKLKPRPWAKPHVPLYPGKDPTVSKQGEWAWDNVFVKKKIDNALFHAEIDSITKIEPKDPHAMFGKMWWPNLENTDV